MLYDIFAGMHGPNIMFSDRARQSAREDLVGGNTLIPSQASVHTTDDAFVKTNPSLPLASYQPHVHP